MLIAKINNPVPMDYKQAFPNTSFPPSGPSDEFLAEQGYAKVNVFKEFNKETEKLESCEPYSEGEWVYTVRVVPRFTEYTDEEGVVHTVAEQEAAAIEADRKSKVPQVVTIRQARLALLQAGLLDDIDAAIAASTERSLKIEWEYASTIERNSPWVQALTVALGLSSSQLDSLFEEAIGL